MATGGELLPRNASTTALERALATALSDILSVPLRDILAAASTPVRFLPFLAAHESVDLWYEDWADARKRLMVDKAPELARLKGTRAATAAFLAFVDGRVVDRVSYPTPFVLGRSRIGRTPIAHPPYVARFLVKVETKRAKRALVLGRSIIRGSRLHSPSREPFRRCLAAMRAAKAPSAEHRVDFAHKRQVRMSDSIPIDGTHRIGAYLNRTRL